MTICLRKENLFARLTLRLLSDNYGPALNHSNCQLELCSNYFEVEKPLARGTRRRPVFRTNRCVWGVTNEGEAHRFDQRLSLCTSLTLMSAEVLLSLALSLSLSLSPSLSLSLSLALSRSLSLSLALSRSFTHDRAVL